MLWPVPDGLPEPPPKRELPRADLFGAGEPPPMTENASAFGMRKDCSVVWLVELAGLRMLPYLVAGDGDAENSAVFFGVSLFNGRLAASVLARVGFGRFWIFAKGDALGCAKRELLEIVTVAGLSSEMKEPSESSATPA